MALQRLAREYWYPIYAYVRRKGYDSHTAEDLTQGFFVQLISTNSFARADRAKGFARKHKRYYRNTSSLPSGQGQVARISW